MPSFHPCGIHHGNIVAVPRGYDWRPVAPVELDEVARTIVIGMMVLDIDDMYIGEVDACVHMLHEAEERIGS